MALGGSTNAIIHLIAMARRAGIALDLDRFDAFRREVPVIANIRPSGQYLMEDFFYAGGLPGLMKQNSRPLDLSDALTVTAGRSARTLEGAKVYNDDVIHPLDNPIYEGRRAAVLTRQSRARMAAS
jgi:dihydroxyacid dehydratase/phosphogluconate dehydratase